MTSTARQGSRRQAEAIADDIGTGIGRRGGLPSPLVPTDSAPVPHAFTTLDDALAALLARTGKHLVVAAPLGIGKPHRLLNAIYRRVAGDPSMSLNIHTALSLTPPKGGVGLEGRFLGPFAARHFGEDFRSTRLCARAETRRAAGEHPRRGVLHAVGRPARLAAGAAQLCQPQLHPCRACRRRRATSTRSRTRSRANPAARA